MKSQNGKAWIFTMLLLATCTAARGQSTMGVGTSGMVAGDTKGLGEGISLLPADNLGKASNWLGSTASLSSSPRSGDDSRFGLTREGQPLPNLFGTPQRRGIQELLPALARGSSSSGVQDGSPAVPAGDKTTIDSPGGKSIGTSSGVKYWALQGLMFASLAVAVEATHRCLKAGSCTAIPAPFQSRRAMVSVGVPFAAGISILSFELKKHGNHWWYLPPAILTGADALLAIHSARASQ